MTAFQFLGRLPDVYQFHFLMPKDGFLAVSYRVFALFTPTQEACAYCGDRILADQEVEIIERIVGKGRKLDNLVYVHKRCAYDAYRVYGGCESSGSIDLIQLLQDYIEGPEIDQLHPKH